MGEGGNMLATLGSYVTQIISWVGSALNDSNVQPFLLLVAAVGIVGAVISLAKYIVHVHR